MKPQITYQLWQQYNESGKIENVAFDFKGNLLAKKQQVISSTVLKTALDNYETYLVDWTGLPNILDTQIFETSSKFDALNRVTKITLPENVNSERKEITPTYNRAGALEKVSYDSTEYVENIAYNAKGQRLLIAFGNDIMTRYAYDNLTFRLLRQRSEKYTKTQVGNAISYTPQSGTNKQDDKYIYDLIGNIFGINMRTTACGVGGTNSLDRIFDYDPLYRVKSATGRENVPGGSYPFPGWDDTTRGTDPNTTEAYTRQYTFDKLGNIEQIKQLGTNGFTRDFSYNTGKNSLDTVTIGSNNYNYTYDACSNQLTENTTRQFEWDATNRLLLFKNQTGTSEPTVIAQYLYDSSGNRVKKIVRKQGGSYEIRTYIDGVFEYYTDEIDEQNTIYVMDASTSSAPSRIASVRIGASMGDSTPAIKYNLENNIYSSTVVLDDTGTLVNSQEYYPFGETSFGSYAKKRYQYVGKERDEESGLYYYGARYYMAWACRFISVDKLAANYMQLTPYQNAGNNPINDYDIDGNQGGKTPTTVEINYPEGSITTTKNEHGQYQVTQAQLDAIGPFGTNWNDDRSMDSSTIKLEPGGEIDVVCDKCNHGIDSYVTIHIPKQVNVSTTEDNMKFEYSIPSYKKVPPPKDPIYFGAGTSSLNQIFSKGDSFIKNDATESAKTFYKNFTTIGFGSSSTAPNSLVDSITVYYWKNSDPSESTKVDSYLKAFIAQLKKDFGSTIKINIQNMDIHGKDSGNAVSASAKKKD